MFDPINNPKHYGGLGSPYETIKVIKAWMTPQEVAGFLKGNILKYTSRHRLKNGLEDLKKAGWYQAELVKLISEVGHEVAYPPVLFWAAANPTPTSDLNELLAGMAMYKAVMVSSNQAPHVSWQVWANRGEGRELVSFDAAIAAEIFCAAHTPSNNTASAKETIDQINNGQQ